MKPLGKVRIEATGGSWLGAKVTVDGVVLPVAKLRILPTDANSRGDQLIRAELEVFVDSIHFPEATALIVATHSIRGDKAARDEVSQ